MTEELRNEFKIADFVRHKISGLKGQVYKHYTDNNDCVGVIAFPQPNVGSKYQVWRVEELLKGEL